MQIFHTARTAHLERVSHGNTAGRPRSLVYRDRSYDWDHELANTLHARRVSYPALAKIILHGEADVIEINEPGFVKSLPLASVTVTLARLSHLLWPRRQRPEVVFYAIENLDPVTSVCNRFRDSGIVSRGLGVLAVTITRTLIPYVLRNVDRVAFGTPSARRMYQRYTSEARASMQLPETREFLELPSQCDCSPLCKKAGTLLFVGEFSARKGIPEMLSLWTAVDAAYSGRGDINFVIVGKGELQQEVAEWAAQRGNATVIVDPPTLEIHRHYREATVTFLLSQDEPAWREQVGLPIKEAVAHGCLVVTTSGTGLADWLANHGHIILESPRLERWTAQVVQAIEAQTTAHQSLEHLPAIDGREQADRWLHRDHV